LGTAYILMSRKRRRIKVYGAIMPCQMPEKKPGGFAGSMGEEPTKPQPVKIAAANPVTTIVRVVLFMRPPCLGTTSKICPRKRRGFPRLFLFPEPSEGNIPKNPEQTSLPLSLVASRQEGEGVGG